MTRSSVGRLLPLLLLFACSKAEKAPPIDDQDGADTLGANAVVAVGPCMNDCAAKASSEGDAAKERCREICRKECRKDCARPGVSSGFQDACHADCDRQIDQLEP